MSRIPRILPLAGVAVAGVLAVNFLAGADTLPKALSGAKAWAEGVEGKAPEAKSDAAKLAAAKPAAVCAPTAAELAKEAGLSPSELRMLQDLGSRRGQLDAREEGFDTQLQLLNAAETKVDAKIKSLDTLKADIRTLLGQADAQQEQEVNRLVAVFSAMKAKSAAAQFRVLDNSVRIPIAAKMKERVLAAILAQMPPAEAKEITELLAKRFTQNAAILAGRQALAPEPQQLAAAAPQPEEKAAPPAKPAARPAAKIPAKSPSRPKAKPPAQAALAPPIQAALAPPAPKAAAPVTPPAATPPAVKPPEKAG